jgi:uncharacterized protein (UPF0248 family)
VSLQWDESFNKADFVVGYEDRFLGIMEVPVERFERDVTSESFVPFHRVQYFKNKDEIVWDRRTKIDKIFHDSQ